MQNQTIALAIQALEAERNRVDDAIAELKGLNGRSSVAPRRAVGRVGPTTVVVATKAQSRGPRRRLSPAGRRALAESARRRWAKARAAGKSTL
jgi:hypothetical protein